MLIQMGQLLVIFGVVAKNLLTVLILKIVQVNKIKDGENHSFLMLSL